MHGAISLDASRVLERSSGEKYRAAYFDRFPGVWRHGDYAAHTEHDGIIIYGRSDAVLNPGGVRIGTAEIYRQVEQIEEVIESLVIGQQWGHDERIVLFVRLKHGVRSQQISKIASGGGSGKMHRHGMFRRESCKSWRSRGPRAGRSSSWPCGISCTGARSRTLTRSRIQRRSKSIATEWNCSHRRGATNHQTRAGRIDRTRTR